MNRFLIVLLALVMSLPAFAQNKAFSFDASVDYKTAYFFRGAKIMDSSDGLIFQPAAQFAS